MLSSAGIAAAAAALTLATAGGAAAQTGTAGGSTGEAAVAGDEVQGMTAPTGRVMPAPGAAPSAAEDAQEERSTDRALKEAEADLDKSAEKILGDHGASTIPKE